MDLKHFQDFPSFIKELAVAQIHYFSNSGKTDYGVGYIVEKEGYIGSDLGKGDKLIWRKRVTELSKEEYLQFSDTISSAYEKYTKEYIDAIKTEILLSKNINKIAKALPFTVTDHYDVLYFNIDEIEPDKHTTQSEIDEAKKHSTTKQITSINDVIDLSYSVLFEVIDILTNGGGNVRAMWV